MGRSKPIVADGFGGGSDVKQVIKLPEGLASAGSEAVTMPDGFGAESTNEPKAVEGFTSSRTKAPPPEGFSDSNSNQGLGSGEKGYIDLIYEDESSDSGVYEEVDIGPWSDEESDDDASANEYDDVDPSGKEEEDTGTEDMIYHNMEPGGYGFEETSDSEMETGEEGTEEDNSLPEPSRQRAFTAQLKAAGYGGFHEWRLQFIKQMLESNNRAKSNR